MLEITEKVLKLEAYGCISIFVDLEPYSENINIKPGLCINILEENKSIKVGDMINVKILKYYIKPDKILVMAATLDLNDYYPFYNK